jgi:hypothetical protein
MTPILATGTRVEVIGERAHRTGTVAGYTALTRSGRINAVYLVTLDDGFYDPTGTTYISVVVVSVDCVRVASPAPRIPDMSLPPIVTCERCGQDTGCPERHEIYCAQSSDHGTECES